MNIIVVGCGKIGFSIVTSLVEEGHDVLVIDNDDEVVSRVVEIHDVMAICGNGADSDILREAGAENAELFVGVTDSDELNMLCCYLAKCMGAKHTISRIRNPEYNDKSLGFMRRNLGISMSINPELLAACEIFNILKLPSAIKIETFARGNFEMVELSLKEDSKFIGIPLAKLRNKYRAAFLICVVQRGKEVFIPDGRTVLQVGDKIEITASHIEIQKVLKEAHLLKKQIKSVIIMGGGTTTIYLARLLLTSGISVKIIERNIDVCKRLCEKLPKAVIINGDGAQQELLMEEGLDSTDAFVSLTGMDEENILMSIFAMTQNVPKVITKVNRHELADMAADNLGVDCIISPHKIIADVAVRYARALQNSMDSNVETLYKLVDGEVEALEFNVYDESDITGIPFSKLSIKPNILIAGILRNRDLIIPSGDDMILPGDHVFLVVSGRKLRDLIDIIR